MIDPPETKIGTQLYPAPAEPARRGPTNPGVTFRAVIIGLLLIPLHAWWITIFEVRWYSLDSTSLPLMITPISMLFAVVLVNMLVRWLAPRRALVQSELLTIYIMLVISGVFASHDVIQNLFGAIGHAERQVMTRPNLQWEGLFFQYLPRWLFVFNEPALKAFYEGNTTPWGYLSAWTIPLLWWAVFLALLTVLFLSVNIVLRVHWTRHEKLTFPLVQLPLAMTGERDHLAFYRSPFMWIGFGLAVAIGTINGLATLYPSVPYLSMVKQYNVAQTVTTRPWSVLNPTNISMYPFMIGIGYFIPLDLSFSCWFFFLARKAWQVFGASMGWDAGLNQGFPYFGEQASGAWIALGLAVAWGMRTYLRQAWSQAWRERNPEDAEEAKRLRLAFVAGPLALLGVMVFALAMGLSPWVAVAFFAVYFILSFTITRVRAELGVPHEIYFVNPQQILVNLFGTKLLGAADLTLISSMYWLHRGYRSHPMPNQLEALRMAESGGIRVNRLLVLIVGVSLYSIFAAYWANLKVTYWAGASSQAAGFKVWVGAESFDRLQNWLLTGQPRDALRLIYMAVGAGVVVFLSFMRSLFIWWPFHPAGYALSVSFAMDYFWFCMLIAWLLKSLLIRYGGMKTHNRFIPLFLGLILGDFTIGSIWAIIGPLMGTLTYKIYI